MAVVNDTDFLKQLKSGNVSGAYYLYGPETAFTLAALKRIEKAVDTGAFDAFNRVRFDGAKLDMDALAEACEALPMMAPQKCVVIRDINADKLAADVLDRLIAVVNDLPDSTVLVICNTVEQVDPKKIPAKVKKLIEAFKKNGTVCEFARKDRTALKRALCERAAKQYINLEADTAEYMIDRCGSDYATLLHELEKLCAYVKDREITRKDIDDCCIATVEASAFELAKCILSSNYDKALNLIDDLFSLRQEPVAILGALSMAFADLYRAKCAMNAGVSPEQTAVDFAYPKNRLFAVKNARRDAGRFTVAQIRGCVKALYRADLALKSSRTPPRLVLEQMLGEMRLVTANS